MDSARIMYELLDISSAFSSRLLSSAWHLSISLAYLPAWIIVSLIWHFRIFSATNAGLILVIHLILGFSLASWSFFVAVPFGKSPQLAAVASTFLSLVFAILALVFSKASTGAAFIFTLIFPPGYYIFAIRAIAGFEVQQIGTNVLDPDPDNNLRLLPIMIAAIVGSTLAMVVPSVHSFYFRSIFSSGLGLQFCLSLVCTMHAIPNHARVGLFGIGNETNRLKMPCLLFPLTLPYRYETWARISRIHSLLAKGSSPQYQIFRSISPNMVSMCY